jgi:hypothetical protein
LGCEASPEAVLAERDQMGWHAWAGRLIRDANIRVMLMDYGFRGPQSYNHQETSSLLLPGGTDLRLETLAQELILRYDTFDGARGLQSGSRCRRAARYVSLKSIIAYRTGLAIRAWPVEKSTPPLAR